MTLPDTRMIELIERLTAMGQIRYRQGFLNVIGMPKQGYRNIIIGKNSFTVKQITLACEEYKVDANWILGLRDGNPFKINASSKFEPVKQ